jgi:hypothetical protein
MGQQKGSNLMKGLCLCFLMLGVSFAEAREINVADHGIVPGKDVTYPLGRLIESVQGESDITLVFPKGRYDFYPENAVEMHRAVSNHDNSLKRIAFPLLNFRNVTVDGGNSLFMFHGRISPFVLDGTAGATLKRFSIDWNRSFHDELRVVARDEQQGSFVVEIDRDKYPYSIQDGNLFSDKYDWQDRMGSNIVFDPKTRAPIYNTRDYSINFARPHKATAVGENRVRIEAAVRRTPPPVGSVLISYGTHPTSRLCPAIHLASSRDINIQDVTIYEAGGMGVIAERTENVHLDRVTVTSTEDRLVSTRADATHFIGCKGMIRVENCLFEHMLDDAINVHGAYIKVVEYLGNNEFLCEISHFQQWGLIFAEPGDQLAVLSRETVLPCFRTKVTETRVLNEHRVVITVSQVPERMPEGPLSMENLSWYPDLVMRKNVIRENRARSALVTTKGKVLIEENTFSSQMHGILIEGDNNSWYESGAVEDVTIRNNTFVNSGFEGGERYPLYASPLLTPEQRMGEGHYHRNIRFVNNRLNSFNGLMVFARSVKGLEILGNTLELSTDYPPITEFPSVNLQYCDSVTIKDNTAKGFDRPAIIANSADVTNLEVGRNEGFETE